MIVPSINSWYDGFAIFHQRKYKKTKTHTCPSPMDKMQISALSKLSHFR